jgi:hypothetical protein
MSRDDLECLTCGQPVGSIRAQILHCDPAAFNPSDPDDNPSLVRGID